MPCSGPRTAARASGRSSPRSHRGSGTRESPGVTCAPCSPAADPLVTLWRLAGGDPDALTRVTLRGDEPALPGPFRVGTAASAVIAAAGLAAAELWRHRTGRIQG